MTKPPFLVLAIIAWIFAGILGFLSFWAGYHIGKIEGYRERRYP